MNLKQILRMDCVSAGLRPYLLKASNGSVLKSGMSASGAQTEMKQMFYEISFRKLVTLFPNTEQIHLFQCVEVTDSD